ncbi:phosphoribosyltransferase family protein [Paenibacillus athensensis]|nr:phosphoribosyltransferase family protein [Paenibacillus athensensis]MCD1261475.1 phosphoribosyltransferase family protein [Paenibacillus athensensis]
MNNSILSLSSPSTSTSTFRILGDLQVGLRVTANPYGLPLDALFALAARMNKKRGFLFVSKLLGKHIPVAPHTPLLAGAALALLLAGELGLATGLAMTGMQSGEATDEPAADSRIEAEERSRERRLQDSQASPKSGEPELLERLLQLTVAGLVDPAQAEDAYRAIIDSALLPAEPVKFIGFAETATALGHSMYQAFAGGCTYIHTTRELLPERKSLLNFEEEHSHATTHRCYAADPGVLDGEAPVVLVDDEMTTGRTALNIIRDIHRQYPRRTYYVAALLDWRTAEDERRFADLVDELGVTIKPLSLIKGELSAAGLPPDTGGGPLTAAQMDGAAGGAGAERGARLDGGAAEEAGTGSGPDAAAASTPEEAGRGDQRRYGDVQVLRLEHPFAQVAAVSADGAGVTNAAPYLTCTGRFGLDASSLIATDRFVLHAAEALRAHRSGGPLLCMGTGEFMYIPLRIAALLGEDVSFQSTTRSPIYPHDQPGYGVRSGFTYASPEDPEVRHFMYNIAPGQYDELFVFMEREVDEARLAPMREVLQRLGIPRVIIIVFTGTCEKREG